MAARRPKGQRQPRAAALSDEQLRRAVLYSALPGVRRQQACDRFGVTLRQLRGARQATPEATWLSRTQLVLAALTRSGELREGTIGAKASIAAFVDWQNHDGTRAEDVDGLLAELVAAGWLALAGARWRLLRPWP